MANGTDPFTPRTPLSREVLERYAQGELSPEEQHDVELHLQSDPLLREALEGLSMPGAVAAFHNMSAPHMPGSSNWPMRVLWSSIAIVGAALLVTEYHSDKPVADPSSVAVATPSAQEEAASRIAVDSTLTVVHAEIDARPTSTESTSVSPLAQERFSQRATSSVAMKREQIERIDGQPMKVEPPAEVSPLHMKHARRGLRQLVFLHGLKLVHPSELYGKDLLLGGSTGVPANVDQTRTDNIPTVVYKQRYLDFMNEALGDYVNGDLRTALDDLYFLLGQYPDDVNAQFYAGLTCYHLGLYPRAEKFFSEAGANKVDCFDEESEWYHALTLEKMDGFSAAKPAFEHIVNAEGFYADQAAKQLAR